MAGSAWTGQPVVTSLIIVEGGTSGSGIFVYSGTPALGNLIGSWTGAAGTDSYGNSYPEGLNVSVGTISGITFAGANWVLDSSGLFFYSGTPALGNLILSLAPASGSDTYGNTYPQGLGLTAGSIPGGLIQSGTVGTSQLGSGVVTTAKVAAGAITTALIASGAVTASQIAAAAGILGTQLSAGTITNTELSSSVTARSLGGITTTISGTAPSGAVAGDIWIDSANGYQLQQYTGSAWTPVTFTATDVIAANSITAALITANTITASQIASGTITSGQIAAGTIIAGNIAAGTITAALLAAGIIYAGIVNGTTISGAVLEGGQVFGGLLEADSSGGGLFIYSSPAQPLNQNYNFAAGVSPWTGANGATLTASALNTYAGSPGSMLLTPNGSSSNPEASSESTIPVTAGVGYGITAQVFSTAGWATGVELVASWFNSSGGAISSVTSAAVALPAAVQTQFAYVVTSPALAAFAKFSVRLSGTPAASVTAYIGQAVLGPNGTLILSAAGMTADGIDGAPPGDMFGNPYRQGLEIFGASNLLWMTTKDASETAPALLSTYVGGSGGTRVPVTVLETAGLGSGGFAVITLIGGSEDGSTTGTVVNMGTPVSFYGTSPPGAATLALNGGAAALYGITASGQMGIQNSSSLALGISGSALAAVGGTTITSTTKTSIGFLNIPAGDVVAGACYECFAAGSYTTGTSVPSGATFGIYWGGVAGTALVTISPVSIATSASAAGWFIRAEVLWLSATAAFVNCELGWHTAAGVTGSTVWFAYGNVSGLTTSSGENLSLGFTWGSAPASTSLFCAASRVGRIA
jgi:hypothetical protein